MIHRHKHLSAGLLAMAAILSLAPIQGAWAQTAPSLGTASNFAILGGAGVTCTASGVAGDVGSLVSVTGIPNLCTHLGTVHALDGAAADAFNDFVVAYDALAAMPCDAAHNLTGQPLGGMTLAPGVYCFNTTADLTTGTLTLDGSSNSVWVFQVGTGITTGTASVAMINGALSRNVFWKIGTAATIGTDTAFMGNILAGSAVNFTGTNSSLVGRAFAKTAVTMTGANILLGSDDGVQPLVKGPTAPSLGTASDFAVLGGAGVTCTTSGVAGNVGSLVAVTGFPPPAPALCALVGSVHVLDGAAADAFNDFVLAYDALAVMPCDAAHNLTGQPLGGKTLAPGVYCFPSTTAELTAGTLTLDAGGDSDAVWVFQVGTAITTGAASVVMINGGQSRNVFWQLGTAATIGTDTQFAGNILAGSAINFTGANSSLVGRALAKTAVTMTGARISP